MSAHKENFWRSEIYRQSSELINQENRLAIRLLANAGLPLSAANVLAQTILNNRALSLKSCWLFLYFALLTLFERKIMPQNCKRATVLLYFLTAPVMIISILMGTVWDPNHQALTFLLFLLSMPVFILDRPARVLGVITFWTAVFLALCMLVKDPATHRGDFFHVLEFLLAAITVTGVVLRVRMEALTSLERTRYHLEHDELTGARNRRALGRRLERYLGRPVLVMMCELDQLTLYNDFFGHETGDEMITLFVQVLSKVFGEEDTYRYGGDEFLCVLAEDKAHGLEEKLKRCRAKLRGNEFNERTINLTCAFGYATGVPEDSKTLQNMVQLADIFAHKARNQGLDQTLGAPFTPTRLNHAIVESNTTANARTHEINQLTQLPSIAFFVERCDNLLSKVANPERDPVVGFINLLHFRAYNDRHGYARGDKLIRFSAEVLRRSFPQRMLCCINGTQFGVMCYRDEVEQGMTRLRDALDSYGDGSVTVRAGFAPCAHNESTISLLDRARQAHESIEEGAFYRFYDEKLAEELQFKQYIINHVDEAVEQGWLKVYYQPIVRSVTGKICNEEALSRWVDPVYGFLPPYRFIPLLEENRLIYKVSLNVVRQILADFRTKEAAGMPIVPVSVNLSRYDFQQCDMVAEITKMVDESGYSREMLRIEITESAFVEDQQMLKREVERLRENGFRVWMDDFGSEYSTLNLLQELSFDLIKIDMQFMRSFSENERNRIIVSDILDMARRMDITTLIEGVETPEHVQALRSMGCEKLQGFYYDRPQPLETVMEKVLGDDCRQMEHWDQSAYYESLGRVDLNAPFSNGGQCSVLGVETEIPAGILELREERLTCVLGNSGFWRRLVERGVAKPEQQGSVVPVALTEPPVALLMAAQRCMQREDWVSYADRSALGGGGEDMTCYLRRISVNEATGALALLAVVLRSSEVG